MSGIIQRILKCCLTSLATLLLVPIASSNPLAKSREIDNHFSSSERNKMSFFKTLPLVYSNPREDSILTSVRYEKTDATIYGKSDTDIANKNEVLKVDGDVVSPAISFHGKTFGLGITGTTGSKASTYTLKSQHFEENSSLKFTGMGPDLTWSPLKLRKESLLTFAGGAQFLNVSHSTKSSQSLIRENLNYKIINYHLGAHLNIELVPGMTLIPWVSFMSTDDSDLAVKLKKGNLINSRRFAGDREIYWQSNPQGSAGVDIALKYFSVKIHTGNIINEILSQNSNSDDRINSSPIRIGISYDLK